MTDNSGSENAESDIATVTVTFVRDSCLAALDSTLEAPLDIGITDMLLAECTNENTLYSIVEQPAKGFVSLTDAVTGAYIFRSYAGNQAGDTDVFTFKVSENGYDSNIATVTVMLVPPCLAEFNSILEVPVDNPTTGSLILSDTDNSFFGFSILSEPAKGSVGTVIVDDTGTGTYTYTPFTGSEVGDTDTFTFEVKGKCVSSTADVTVRFTEPVNVPVASDGNLEVRAGETATGILAASDPDNDPLTFSIVTQPVQGTVTITDPATGDYSYTANANAGGTDSFTFKVTDSDGSESDIVAVTVSFIKPVQ